MLRNIKDFVTRVKIHYFALAVVFAEGNVVKHYLGNTLRPVTYNYFLIDRLFQ